MDYSDFLFGRVLESASRFCEFWKVWGLQVVEKFNLSFPLGVCLIVYRHNVLMSYDFFGVFSYFIVWQWLWRLIFSFCASKRLRGREFWNPIKRFFSECGITLIILRVLESRFWNEPAGFAWSGIPVRFSGFWLSGCNFSFSEIYVAPKFRHFMV